MLAGVSLSNIGHLPKVNILLCGTGAGVFTMFLRHHFGDRLARLVTVDISQKFVDLGQKHFGFTPNDGVIESVICDAFEYVNNCKDQFDLIFMDVCFEQNESGISPPKHFLTTTFLTQLKSLVSKDGGVVAINTMVKGKKDQEDVLAQAKAVVNCLKFVSKCTEDINEVLYLASQPHESGLES